MEQPELLVDEYKKTTKWIEGHLSYYQMLSYSNAGQKKNDQVCWEYYNNKTDVAKFEYLTQMGNYHLPSQIRHIPLQRNNCDLLISSKSRRVFTYDCFASDRTSLQSRYNLKIESITQVLMDGLNKKYHEDLVRIAEVDQQVSELQQMMQTQPKDPQQAAQIQVLKQNFPRIMHQYEYIKDQLQYAISLTEEDEKKLKVLSGNTTKELKEIIALNAAKKLRRVLYIDNESRKNFTSDIVIGRGAFFVDVKPGDKYPTFKAMNMMKVYYPQIDGIDWIQDGPWVKIEEGKSFQDIVTLYGTEIQQKYGFLKLQELKDISNIQQGTFVSAPGYTAIYVDSLYTGSSTSQTHIPTEKIYFKVPRKIKVKYSPNPYAAGEYFRKFLDGNKPVINEDDFTFDKPSGCYINKRNESEVYKQEDVETYKTTKGQQLKVYYMNDIYEGIIINRNIIINARRKQCVLRNPDFYPDVKLPVFGRTHAGINDQPYSLIKDTINLQDMYDLINYYRDLMLALSGPKTILYDRSFKPTTMSDTEWEYQKKMGTLFIQTYDKATGQRNLSSFNQFTMFDMSVSPTIQYFDTILQSLKETMGDIVGVPRQRKGELVGTDQVGTYEMSIKQAALITEIRFDRHDEVEAKAFEACINLYLKYCLKDVDFIDVFNKDFSLDIKKLPKNLFDDVKIDVIIANNSEQDRLMAEMKDVAMVGLKSGTIQYDGIVKTFLESQNLIEFKNSVEYYTTEAKNLAAANAGAAEEQKAQIVERAEKLRQEYEGFWKQKELEAKAIGDQILAENNRITAQILAERNQIEREKMERDSAIKMLEISAEDKIETGLLSETREARINQQKLEALKIQLEQVINTMSIKSDKDFNVMKHIEGLKKIDVEKEKAKGMKKEHLND